MYRRYKEGFSIALLAMGFSTVSFAQGVSSSDLLNLLVAEGIISEEKALKLVEKVNKRKQRSVLVEEEVVSPDHGTVRATYVPQYVKDEIRRDVEQSLRAKVTEDVVAHAKTERWGIPNALPSWVNSIKFYGDARVRYEGKFFDKNNPPEALFDLANLNDAGGVAANRDIFVNVNDDRHRLRGRFRFGMKAKVTEGVEVGVRMVTGNENNPVSTNQSFGNYGGRWDANVDLAYIRYRNIEKSIRLEGGRFKNPFLHTDLVWDNDLTFEGIAARWNILRKDDMDDDFRQWDPFIIVGAFPLDEVNQYIFSEENNDANDDKWLYAVQLGTHFDAFDQSRLSMGLGYYHYDNVQGIENAFDSDLYDASVPSFFQYGNSTYDINIENADQLYALAAEFELINATIKYDYAGFSPYHVWLTADYVKNVAFDRDDITRKLNIIDDLTNEVIAVADRDEGYQFGVAVGWPVLSQRGNWRVSLDYRHLEGDAVIDAFADSDFLMGGTNAKGYVLRGDYAILDNVWMTMRWISANELDADTIVNVGVETLQFDINTQF